MKIEIPEGGIEGLTTLDASVRQNSLAGSKFALPPGFNSKKYASKWVEEGTHVTEAEQPTAFVSAGVSAAGWSVYKQIVKSKGGDDNKVAKTDVVKRAVGKTTFILMFRPKALQRVVNIIHANESRELVSREVSGESSAVNNAGDRGILTADDMARNRQIPSEREDQEGYLRTTPLSTKPEQAVELNLAPA